MATVLYEREFLYPRDPTGNPFPILPIQLALPDSSEGVVETYAYLDSGAEYSLFAAQFARMLRLEIVGGARRRYSTATSQQLNAAVRHVRLSHPELGGFDMALGFSEEIARNLLGRDFFNLIQIGFRERHSTFYITPQP